MSEVELARPSAENRESFADFESLLSDLSSRFISLPPEEVDREIEAALRRVCEPLEHRAGGALAMGRTRGRDVIRPTHIYCADEQSAAAEPMRQEQYPWARGEMLAGQTVVVPAVASLPAGGRRRPGDLPSLRHPVDAVSAARRWVASRRSEPWVSTSCRAEREWPDAAGEAAAAGRRRSSPTRSPAAARQEPRGERGPLAAGAELAGLAFYEVDFGTGAMFVDDRLPRHLRHSRRPASRASQAAGVLDGASASRRPPARSGPAPAVARRQAGAALHRVPLPAPDPGREVDPPPGARRQARPDGRAVSDLRRPARHHASASAPRRSGAT